MQPWIKSNPIAGRKMPLQPDFGGGSDQGLDAPGFGVDLFWGLQRIAAMDEYRGRLRQYDREACGAGKSGQPGQPLFRRRDIFVLLLIGAGDDESGQMPSRELLAKRR